MKTVALGVRYVSLKESKAPKTIVTLRTNEITVNGSGYMYKDYWIDGHRTDIQAGIVEVELDEWDKNSIKTIKQSEK